MRKEEYISLRNAPRRPKYSNPVGKKNFYVSFFLRFSMFYDILRRFGAKKFLCLWICRFLLLASRSVRSVTLHRNLAESSKWCQNLRNLITRSWLDFGPDRITVTSPIEQKCDRKHGFWYKNGTKWHFLLQKSQETAFDVYKEVVEIIKAHWLRSKVLGSVQQLRQKLKKQGFYRVFHKFHFFNKKRVKKLPFVV